jgi:O-antigen ligase
VLYFVGVIVLFAAINACFNIYYYSMFIQQFSDIFKNRLGVESIGVATGKVPTTFALTYSLYCIASLIIALEINFFPAKVIYASCFFELLLSLILTQSRGALFALLITSGIYLYLEKDRLSRNFKLIFFLLSFSIIFGILGYFFYINRLNHDGNRIGVWKQAIEIALEKPWFGYGENDFFIPMKVSPNEILYHGHNLFINSQLRGGILGLLAILSIIRISFFRVMQAKKIFSESIPICWLLVLIISGIFDYDIVVRSKGWEWISFWTVLGLVLGVSNKAQIKSDLGLYKFI